MTTRCRTLWISDIHLGNGGSCADDLQQVIGSLRPDRLFLTGDLIDLERMRNRPEFPIVHGQVVSSLVWLADAAPKVFYIPASRDHDARPYAGRDIFGIPVMLEAQHGLVDGRKLLVTDGDILDERIRKATNLEKFSARSYRLLLELDDMVKRLQDEPGGDHPSISSRIGQRLKSAREYRRRFEEVSVRYAIERGFDGIVCGHIHRPALRNFGDVRYANTGDWVGHRTALIEDFDGTLKLISWGDGRVSVASDDARGAQIAA
jgi:UDP-2,3-diacylglucosamine pyrophosphatase LpxH